MPLQQTSGAASYDAFGGGVAAVPKYIEDYFSTFLYSGNAGTQTVTNGIDLSTKGGMVWIKSRSGAYPHSILDTVRGFNYSSTQTRRLDPSTTDSQADAAGNATQASPLTDGFSVTTSGGGAINFYNASGSTYTSWSWAKAPKFFDVVTYTGNGTNGRAIPHNLGSTPGCILIKQTSGAEDWIVYHRSLGQQYYAVLNSTIAFQGPDTAGPFWNTAPTDTTFTVRGYDPTNKSGSTYVAYLFAHDAGGFGLTGTDNVISCGSVSATGSTLAEVNLGWEPQWLLIKGANINNGWNIIDNMRGFTANNGVAWLIANSSGAEIPISPFNTPGVYLTSTGFKINANESPNNGTGNYIYIAIRRGPMKVPTSGTSVFKVPYVRTGGGSTQDITGASYPVNDLVVTKSTSNTQTWAWTDRLRGATKELTSAATTAETTYANDLTSFAFNTGFQVGSGAGGQMNTSGYTYIDFTFRRAPSFFDEVCYSGNSTARTINHNLGVAPELMIVKARSGTNAGSIDWFVYASPLGNRSRLLLNDNGALADGQPVWNSTTPTSSVFSLGTSDNINGTGYTYVNYLFSTCAGVSKVGSYTGTGTTKQIDCGFTGGARFVLIKRTDSTGDWYVWDSARGIVSGNDPYLLLNSTAAEVTNTDYIDTYSAGFEISSTAPAAINASGGSFIFLAVA